MTKKSTTKQKKNMQFAVMIVQLILIIGILLGTTLTYSKVSSTQEKVNKIDSFFEQNAQGYGTQETANNKATGSQTPEKQNTDSRVEVSEDDDPYLGNENAKVTVIEFSDYQCPFCRRYWTESYPQLKEEYIDTGKIKYVFRDFPLNFHPGAPLAAVAANCVREQKGNEGYFEFHDIVFEEQNKQGTGTIQFGEEEVLSWVDKVSELNEEEFMTCYNDPNQLAEVEADFAAGQEAGVSGTPTFFINGKQLTGAQPYSVIKAEIEQALNE